MLVQVYHGTGNQKGAKPSKRNTWATVPNNCIYRMAAFFVHWCSKLPWGMQKNIATTWAGTVGWNLHFHLLKEFHWNCRVNQKATWQSNSKNHQCKYQVLCMYIYTVFAIAVYLGSTFILIYTWSTNWHNESLCFKMLLGKEFCHSYTKTTYQKPIAPKSKQPRIELRINTPKTIHLSRTLTFHMIKDEKKI